MGPCGPRCDCYDRRSLSSQHAFAHHLQPSVSQYWKHQVVDNSGCECSGVSDQNRDDSFHCIAAWGIQHRSYRYLLFIHIIHIHILIIATGCKHKLLFHHPNSLALWLKADDIGITNDNLDYLHPSTERVVGWPDRSGQANDFVAVELGGGPFSARGGSFCLNITQSLTQICCLSIPPFPQTSKQN